MEKQEEQEEVNSHPSSSNPTANVVENWGNYRDDGITCQHSALLAELADISPFVADKVFFSYPNFS